MNCIKKVHVSRKKIMESRMVLQNAMKQGRNVFHHVMHVLTVHNENVWPHWGACLLCFLSGYWSGTPRCANLHFLWSA